MPNGPGEWSSGFRLDWQTLIMTVGVILVMVGGFWTLAYLPIQNALGDLKQQMADLRETDLRNLSNIESKYLAQREFIEFKNNYQRSHDLLQTEMAVIRREAATRQDVQQALNTTRIEFLSEVKRLDQADTDNMKRREFDAWKTERDARLQTILNRQDRFTEALDAMYSRIMQQAPSYVVPRQ